MMSEWVTRHIAFIPKRKGKKPGNVSSELWNSKAVYGDQIVWIRLAKLKYATKAAVRKSKAHTIFAMKENEGKSVILRTVQVESKKIVVTKYGYGKSLS